MEKWCIFSLLWVYVCAWLCVCGGVPLTPDIDLEVKGRVDEMALRLVECTSAPGMTLALVRDGQVFYTAGYGVKDLESEEPITNKTRVLVASVTKAFVATTLAAILERSEGQYSWQTPVHDILGDDFMLSDDVRTERVTIKDLLSHRAGLPAHNLLRLNDISNQDMVRRLCHLGFTMRLRDGTKYNNLLYGVAGRVAEVLAGRPWEDHAMETLFGMEDTTFIHLSREHWDKMATAYLRDGATLRAVSLEAPAQVFTTTSGSDSVCSNADDLAKWMVFHLSEGRAPDGTTVVSSRILRDTHRPSGVLMSGPRFSKPQSEETYVLTSRSLGWQEGFYAGLPVSNHGGTHGGFLSSLTLIPSVQIGIFVSFTGPIPSRLRDQVTLHLADLMMGKEPWITASMMCDGVKDWEKEGPYKVKSKEELKEFKEKLPAGVKVTLDDLKKVEKIKARRVVEKTSELSNLDIYLGTYSNPVYGVININISEEASQLDMEFGSKARWHLEPVSDMTFSADGYGIFWFNKNTAVFDLEAGKVKSVTLDFDNEDPPTFTKI